MTKCDLCKQDRKDENVMTLRGEDNNPTHACRFCILACIRGELAISDLIKVFGKDYEAIRRAMEATIKERARLSYLMHGGQSVRFDSFWKETLSSALLCNSIAMDVFALLPLEYK